MTVNRTRWALLMVLALPLAAAALPWWPVYRDPRLIVACAAGILLGLGTSALGARFNWPAWRVIVVLVGEFLLVGVPVAVPSKAILGLLPSLDGELDLVSAAVVAWKQLVTIPTPVGHYQGLLVPPFLLTLSCAALGGSIALRTSRRAVAGVFPVLSFAVAIAFGVGSSAGVLTSGILFAGAMLIWLGYTRFLARPTRSDGGLANGMLRICASVAAGALTVGGATVAAIGAPSPPRQVVREVLRPPFDPQQAISPLVGFRAAFAPESKDAPVLSVEGLPVDVGLRIATLDSYDGVVFTVGAATGSASSQFVRVPAELQPQEPGGKRVDLAISSLTYAGLWVPSVGKLRHVDFNGDRAGLLADSFFYNVNTGAQAVTAALAPGDSYRETAVIGPSVDDLSTLTPGNAASSTWVDAPDELIRLLDRWSSTSATPGARLAAMVAGFKRDGYVSHGLTGEPASRAGHGIDRIAELATANPMVGDAEQYAVAAALLARYIGFPTRVVLGYQPTDAERTAAGDGAVTVRNADLTAWVEVQSDDGTWRAFDPNPAARPIPEVQEPNPSEVSRPQSALPPQLQQTRTDVRSGSNDRAPTPPTPQPAWIAVMWAVLAGAGATLAGIAVLGSPFLVVMIAKARRRRLRRRAPTPAQRVDGAWREYLDAATDLGYRFRPGSTRAEQAAAIGGLSALIFSAVADAADFAPERVGDDHAEVAWAQVRQLRRMLGAPRSTLDRLRARVSTASLRPNQPRVAHLGAGRPQLREPRSFPPLV